MAVKMTMAIVDADVNEERFLLTGLHAANHFISESKRDRCHIQSRAGREQPREHENG